MCGIVGFLDKRGQRPAGRTLLAMLQALSCRGPDSAGVAVFGPPQPFWVVEVSLPDDPHKALEVGGVFERLTVSPAFLGSEGHGEYVRLQLGTRLFPDADAVERYVVGHFPGCEVVSVGRQLQVVKQVGSPDQLEAHHGVSRMPGTHGIGHTRLSTESRVDLSHSQPFWAHGVADLATVHNGHITNYHKLRRRYEQRGYRFYTENDSEVIGVYLRDLLAAGLTLADALRSSLDDFDGSFSYLAAWADGLAYVKDRFGFKPLVVAETEDFVGIATEEVALRQALARDFEAREPPPGTMKVWAVPATAAAAR